MRKIRSYIGNLGHRIADFDTQSGFTGWVMELCWRIGYPSMLTKEERRAADKENIIGHITSVTEDENGITVEATASEDILETIRKAALNHRKPRTRDE